VACTCRPHNLRNALAAAACALAAGAPLAAVVQGLSAFRPVARAARAARRHAAGPRASRWWTTATTPTPTRCAPPSTCWPALPAPRWLVLGDMGEVGDQGPAFHAEVGPGAPARHRTAVVDAGALSRHAAAAFGPAARHFETRRALLPRCRRPGRGAGAGQGLALHAHGARGATR
jgi:UDP-N-acetylmuramyl pentapeptide synthase